MFQNMFILAICKSHICYTHVSMSLTIALRMGLHRHVKVNQDLIANEIRKRIFWTLRMFLNEVSANCGMPKLLDDREIDQKLPIEVNDAYIKKPRILPQPREEVCHMAGGNSYRLLHQIRDEAIHTLYPATNASFSENSYDTTFVAVKNLETNLQQWT